MKVAALLRSPTMMNTSHQAEALTPVTLLSGLNATELRWVRFGTTWLANTEIDGLGPITMRFSMVSHRARSLSNSKTPASAAPAPFVGPLRKRGRPAKSTLERSQLNLPNM